MWKIECFLHKTGDKAKTSLTTLNQLAVLVNTTKQEKIKGIKVRKENIKLFLFVDEIIAYVEKSQVIYKKKCIIELISEFSKVTGHKINTQKSILFLY